MQLTVGEYVYTVRMYDEFCTAMQGPERQSVFAADTETVKLVPGQPVIPAFMQVCCHALRQIDVIPAHLMRKYLIEFYQLNPDFTIVFHNAPFDLNVIGVQEDYNAPLLKAIQDNRCVDTGIRYMLMRLSIGRVAMRWRLDLVAKQVIGVEVEKDDEIRLTFRPGMAVTDRHLRYMAADAAVTAQLYKAMPRPYPTEWHQTVGFIALSDIGRRGMHVDVNYMQTLHKEFTARRMENDEVLSVFGYYAGESGNQKVLQSILETVEAQLQCLENNPNLRFQRTEKKGAIQITDESLAVMGNREHPFITAYKEAEHQQKILTTYLNENLVRGDSKVHPSFTPLVRTGRTSCRGPNLQNLPRKENIRGIYIPTPGWLLYAADYSQLELCALSESCLMRFGFSKMADVINDGLDVHKWFAAQVVGKNHDIELVTDEERQMAKACYSADTELLTPSGWRRIDELYESDSEVMQYDPDTKEMTFVKPLRWIKQEDKELISFRHSHMDSLVTADHRMLTRSRDGVCRDVLAKDMEPSDNWQTVHAGHFQGTPVLSELDTRLAVMIQADGSLAKNRKGEPSSVLLGFTKKHKIDRAEMLLNRSGWSYTKGVRANGTSWFRIGLSDMEHVFKLVDENREFLDWTIYDPEAFIEELALWDGRHSHSKKPTGKRQYATVSRKCADVAQLVLITNGIRSNKRWEPHDRSETGGCWIVNWYQGARKNYDVSRTGYMKKEKIEGKHTVYCLTVPSSYVVTRRNACCNILGQCNFGFPGGLGIKTFQYLAKNQYGLDLPEDRCWELKNLWTDFFPEMDKHFKSMKVDNGFSNEEETRYIAETITGRVRRNAGFCSACNYQFQGLAADGARIALWYMWLDKFRMVNFIHDEILTELRDDANLQVLIKRINQLMIHGMKQAIPHVKIEVEGALMRRWYKGAKPIYDEQGNLLIWEPPAA